MFKDIKGFENRYEMDSDTLEVRRKEFDITQTVNGITYTRHMKSKVIKPYIDSCGYYSVVLKRKNYRIHWLYYNTFIGDSTGFYIDHIDRNKLNNNPNNLRLVTPTESCANRTLKFKPSITDFSKYCKYKDKSNAKPYVLYFTENKKRKYIGSYNTYEEAVEVYRELYNKRQKKLDDARY